MATVEDIAQAALDRGLALGQSFPSTRSVMYRRIGVRQVQLYDYAAMVSPEYFGRVAEGLLIAGAADLSTMITPVPPADAIQRIEIADHGSSSYADDVPVHIVPVTDPEAQVPPRATLRDLLFQQVGSDLDGVASIRVYYSKQSTILEADDADTAIELPTAFQELLIIDLAKYLLTLLTDLEPARATAITGTIGAEEKELFAAFDAHLRQFNRALESRFEDPAYTPKGNKQ